MIIFLVKINKKKLTSSCDFLVAFWKYILSFCYDYIFSTGRMGKFNLRLRERERERGKEEERERERETRIPRMELMPKATK